jgi:cell division protein FtsI/penicillin-binding protein 2
LALAAWALALLFVWASLVTPVPAARTTSAPIKKPAAKAQPVRPASKKPPAKKVTASRSSKTTKVSSKSTSSRSSKRRRPRLRRVVYNPWKEPSYADSTEGDFIDGEDLTVRRAAVEALGPLNGSVVVVEPGTGRILTMVNQKLALRGGYTPCSTIKIFVGLGGLSEGVIDGDTELRSRRHGNLNLTEAMAKSDNPFFARVGEQLGFERVLYYSRLFGLGERATLDLDREVPGDLPRAIPSDGVGMMSSFGNGIQLTPLQLAAGLTAIANGGTLYYLQYPQNAVEADRLVPRVKRHLDIARFIPVIKAGMAAAVDYGTARRADRETEGDILGKTGTCTDVSTPTHLGWFGSFNAAEKNPLVVVVLLTGGSPINGPVASGVAGEIYETLSEEGYFRQDRPLSPVALVGSGTWRLD